MSDKTIILAELKQGSITAEQMHRKWGISRTGARVFDLRESGHNIETIKRKEKTRRGSTSIIAEYFLRAAA